MIIEVGTNLDGDLTWRSSNGPDKNLLLPYFFYNSLLRDETLRQELFLQSKYQTSPYPCFTHGATSVAFLQALPCLSLRIGPRCVIAISCTVAGIIRNAAMFLDPSAQYPVHPAADAQPPMSVDCPNT